MPSFDFSDDEAETLQLAVDHALTVAVETYKQVMTDRVHDDLSTFLGTMADAERTVKDLKRIKEEVNK